MTRSIQTNDPRSNRKPFFVSSLVCMLFAFPLFGFSPAAGGCSPEPTLTSSSQSIVVNTEGPLSVMSYGADPFDDDKHDDSLAIQAAIDDQIQAGGGAIYFPPGVYNLHDTIRMEFSGYAQARPLTLIGDGAALKAVLPGDSLPLDSVLSLRIIPGSLSIRGFIIDANRAANHGLRAYKVSGRTSVIEQVSITGAVSHGALLQACQGITVRASHADYNGKDGWHLAGVNAAVISGCRATNNRGNGFTITGLFIPQTNEKYSGGCYLLQSWSEKNYGHGIETKTTTGLGHHEVNGIVIRDGWIEGNREDGVRVNTWNTNVTGLRISSGGKAGTNGINLRVNARANVIFANHLANAGVASYSNIKVWGSAAYHHLAANFYMYAGTLVPTTVTTQL